MLGLTRSRIAVRAALMLGAVLTVTGSVGLHAEPAGDAFGPAQAGANVQSGPGAIHAAPHTCLVCLLHLSTSLAPASGLASVSMPSLGALVPAASRLVGTAARNPHASRAPPASF
ncbi:MAG: hypothetical protein ACHQQS_07845 [Thermoanaerobaculales bacterium]